MSNKIRNLKSLFLAAAILAVGVAAGYPDDTAQRTKEFVVMGYQGILADLKAGDGPYLRTLTDLLKTKENQRTQTIDQVRSLSKSFPNIMDFADRVAGLQTQPQAPTGPNLYSGDQIEITLNHMTRGMQLTVFSKDGGKFSGQFEEYAAKRLWMLKSSRKSFRLEDILAIEAPQL